MSTTLEESARLAGGHVWFERRLFEILGSWVRATPDVAVKLMLDRHSRHHAWRAGQWWERLPVLADVDRDALVAPESPALEAGLQRLADTADDAVVARLAGAYRVALPRLWASYERHRAAADPAGDGSTLRTLGLVGPDVAADWQEGEAALQNLLGTREAVATAAATVGDLEAILVGSGISPSGPRCRSRHPGG